jgi:hypothetical protein
MEKYNEDPGEWLDAECPIGQRLFSQFVNWALLLQSVRIKRIS